MRAWSFACLLVVVSPVSAQSYKAVKDWIGGCDNTRHCTLIGLASADSDSPAMLHFERSGEPSAEIEQITLRVDVPLSREDHYALELDAKERVLEVEQAHLRSAEDDPERLDLVLTRPEEIARILAALRRAQTVTLVGDSGAVGTISLSGASAIMLWVDEQQQRLGTTTALVRKGPQPASSVPLPPPAPPLLSTPGSSALPEAAAKAAGAQVRGTLEPDTCEALEPDSPQSDYAWKLPDGRTLVQLSCSAGAYNFISRWYLVRRGETPLAISFPMPVSGEGRPETELELVNAEFMPETGTISSYALGRGIGDCGSSASWTWDGEAFQLQSYALMDDCRGVSAEFWPTLWRSAD
ncbi:MAG: DUF1176 domain-containing protein [Lysobacterales bacterium]